MSSEGRLVQPGRRARYLTDRQEICDCLVRTPPGNDPSCRRPMTTEGGERW